MGCVSSKSTQDGFYGSESQEPDAPEEEGWTEENAVERIDQLLKDMQEHSLKRMKEEIETDVNTFVLNNLLMCIQFFDNIERAKDAASQAKRDKEAEINTRLAKEPHEGMILGDRNCHLLHGMGEVLTRNYIYRAPENSLDEDYYGQYFYGSDSRNTFMCEGILPMEFFMTWDNLEVYPLSEWEALQGIQYSAAKGSPPIIRFCMEVPDEKNKVPRGYVRLRCADVAADTYKSITDSSYDYAYAGKFSDNASEAPSDSEEGGISDNSVGSDMNGGAVSFMNKLKIRALPITTETNNNYAMNNLRQKEAIIVGSDGDHVKSNGAKHLSLYSTGNNPIARKAALAEKLKNRRPSGVLPEHYPSMEKPTRASPRLNTLSEPNIPSVMIDSSSTPPVTSNQVPNFGNYNGKQTLYPHPQTTKPRMQNRKTISMHNLNGFSSGYETMSQTRSIGLNTSGMSRSSSVASEEIRSKWRQVELKQLWEYKPRNRVHPDLESDKQEPLSNKCFFPMKFEILSSDEEDSEDEGSEYSSSTDEDTPAEIRYEERYYLDSSQFSSEYCSEFHYIGSKHGLGKSVINRAVVLGTTVRAAVPYESVRHDEEDFYLLQSFTPCLHSKSWPREYYLWFNQRMFGKKNASPIEDSWPTRDQIETIDNLGANLMPLGFRSLEFFNTHQSLEWQLNFSHAETMLLNSFKHVHWRTYIFSALIFRAFLAPLGPQGIGIEHIRNILYFMCNEDFVGWNEEQPGVHLRSLLSKLYDCLGKGKMPNFFIQSQDILKSIPPQNARLVQAHLNHIRENLIIFCIYAFRNLTCNHSRSEFYPVPDLKKLYNMLTVPTEKELLGIQNRLLELGMEDVDSEQAGKKKHKKKKDKFNVDLMEKEAQIEGEFRNLYEPQRVKHDKTQSRLRKKHEQYQDQMKRLHAENKDYYNRKNTRENPEASIPKAERRKSIDLKQQPVIQEKFSTFRKFMIIDFFIQHFIEMAKKSNEFRAYSQSAMYILHIENLCDIMLDPKYNLGQTTMDAEKIEDYKNQCGYLRVIVGKELREYVLSRFSHLHLSSLMSSPNIIGELNHSRGPFQSNWDFRKLPTPPGSHIDLSELNQRSEDKHKPSTSNSKVVEKKILPVPDIAKTLLSIPPVQPKKSPPSPTRRNESFKFIDKQVKIKRTASVVTLSQTGHEFESTDL